MAARRVRDVDQTGRKRIRTLTGRALSVFTTTVLAASPLAAQAPWSVSDSAGIRVVRNEGTVWSQDRGWQLSQEPILVIGALEGPEEYSLFRVAWTGILSDGSIAVLNAGSHQLRIYDRTGRFLRAWGRQGEGPGEFNQPRYATLVPGTDTIAVQDGADLKLFHASTGFVRQFRIKVDPPFPWPDLRATTPDGFLYFYGDAVDRTFVLGENGFPSGLPQIDPGVHRGKYAVIEVGVDGAVGDTLTTSLAGGETWVSVEETRRSYAGIPFSPGQRWGFGPDLLATGISSTPSVRFLSPTGTTIQVVHLPLTATPISDDVFWGQFERGYADKPADIRERARERRELMPRYRDAPLFGGINVDSEGFVWVQSYSPADLDDDPRWFVVSPAGRFLGSVARPRIFVDHIGRDVVLGRRRGEFDVEQVVLYEIQGR